MNRSPWDSDHLPACQLADLIREVRQNYRVFLRGGLIEWRNQLWAKGAQWYSKFPNTPGFARYQGSGTREKYQYIQYNSLLFILGHKNFLVFLRGGLIEWRNQSYEPKVPTQWWSLQIHKPSYWDDKSIKISSKTLYYLQKQKAAPKFPLFLRGGW